MNNTFYISPEEIKYSRHTYRLMRQLSAYGECEHSEIESLIKQYYDYIECHKQLNNPLSWASVEVEYFRKDIILRAEIMASVKYDNLLKLLGEGEFRTLRSFEYIAVNPHSFMVNCVIYLSTDFWEIGKIALGNCYLKDEKGKRYRTQRIDTIRGSFLIARVRFLPNQRKTFKLISMSLVSPRFLYKNITNLKYLMSTHPNTWEEDIIQSFDILHIIEKDCNQQKQYAKVLPPKLQLSGAIAKKYCVAYQIVGTSIRYINGYFTFFKGSKRVDVSFDIVKDNCLDKETIYLQLKGAPLLVDGKHQLSIGEECLIDKFLLSTSKKGARVISVYDNNQIVNFNNILSISLVNNYVGDNLTPNNSCTFESRYTIEDCLKTEIDRVVITHDIDAIVVRR